MNDRKCEIKINNQWQEVEFESLKKGDIFRLFENTGEPVIGDNGYAEFVAACDAFIDEDGVWSIDIYY